MAVITLNRGAYYGAKELAEYTAQNLDYPLLSREDLIDQLAQFGWEEDKLNVARQLHLGMMERMNLQWIHYTACMKAILIEKAKNGKLVYHGSQGGLVLNDFPQTLNIKCIADMDYRIQLVMKRNEYAIDRKEAIKIINRADKRRDRWSRVLLNVETGDDSLYDMIIDLSKTSVSDAFERIRSTISLPQFQPTKESQKKIDDLVIAANLRAKIAMESDILDDDISIEINDGIVNVKGTVHSQEDADAIRRMLAQQPEIEDVESSLETIHEETVQAHH